MYLEASFVQPGSLFRLLSPRLTDYGRGPFKVEFSYYMYGRHMGILNVYAISADGHQGDPIWTAPGGQRIGWFS